MTSILVPVLLALNLGLVQDAPPPTGAAEDPYAMGQRLLAEGRLPEARDAFEQAIRANPLSAWPHLGLARVYLQEDRPNRSLLAINMAVDRSRGEPPTQRTMLMFRANVNYLMARLEEAATDLEVVLAAEPSNTEAIFQMGFVRLHQERFDEAMDQGKKLIRAGKRRADGYYFIGQSLFKKGNLANAESTLRTCLELDPRHLRARYALAQVLFRLEKKEESDAQLAIYERLHEATQEIETALKQGPSGTCAHCWRILSLRYPEVGENEKALAYARKVVEARSDEPHARFVLAVSQSRVGKLEEAVETYRGCIDDHPDYLPAYSYLSWLLATAEKVALTQNAESGRGVDRRSADLYAAQRAGEVAAAEPVTGGRQMRRGIDFRQARRH